jgi:hypothetical protein
MMGTSQYSGIMAALRKNLKWGYSGMYLPEARSFLNDNKIYRRRYGLARPVTY